MMVKVISDGRPCPGGDCRVELPSGEQLQGMTAITWRIGLDSPPSVNVTLCMSSAEVAGQLHVYAEHPTDGGLREINRIVFADGTFWEVQP